MNIGKSAKKVIEDKNFHEMRVHLWDLVQYTPFFRLPYQRLWGGDYSFNDIKHSISSKL